MKRSRVKYQLVVLIIWGLAVASHVAAGSILREYWTGINDSTVSELTENVNYPENPTGRSFESSFEAPINWADHYGTRMRGFIYPPTSGKYFFWISGDDNCELWLSTSADPSNKSLIAKVPGAADSREWNKFPEQKSSGIMLEAGKAYYVEALHKEGGGKDNLAVGWQLPNSSYERPVPGTRLVPYPANSGDNGMNFAYYKGAWNMLPDFTFLAPSYTGKTADVNLDTRDQEENFAYKFSGYIAINVGGEYTFYVRSDDGSRLLVDNQLVVNNDTLHSAREVSGAIVLSRGVYPITVLYFQKLRDKELAVSYKGPGISKQTVPANVLYLKNPGTISRKTDDVVVCYDLSEGNGSGLMDRTSLLPYCDLTALGSGFGWTNDGGIKFLAADHNTVFRNAAAGKVAALCEQSGEISIEVWIKTGSLSQETGGGCNRIFSFETNSDLNFAVAQAGSGIHYKLRTSNSGEKSLSGANLKSETDYYHVVAVYKPFSPLTMTGGMRLYLNGNEVLSNTESGAITSSGNYSWGNNGVLGIGNRLPALDRDWLGTVYFAAVYNKALGESDVVKNFNAGPLWNAGPGAPSNLTAVTNRNVITLSWKDNARNETGYQIFRGDFPGDERSIAALPANAVSYSDDVGICGVSRFYSVSAFNNFGESRPVGINAFTVPCVPQNLTASSVSRNEIGLSWNGVGPQFVVEGSVSQLSGWQEIYRGTAKSFSQQGLDCQITRYYRVRAVNPAGSSDWTAPVSAIPVCPIAAPGNLSADVSGPGKVLLSWQDNSPNELGFRIYRKESSENQYVPLVTLPANVTKYSDGSVECNTAYSYYLDAFNFYAQSAASNTVVATTLYCGAGKAISGMVALNGMVLENSAPASGTRCAVARLYADGSCRDSVLYEESFKEVQVKNGYFTVTLGEKSDVASIIRARQNIYFDIMVDGKSVYSRLQPLTASPYSVKSSYSLAGEGSPVGIFCAPMGATFIDTSARSLYLKTGAADSSWTKIGD